MIAVEWLPRRAALEPCGAWAEGPVARRLVQRLAAAPAGGLTDLEGVATSTLVVILGHKDRLPWVDGIQYLGRDRVAPNLLVPTRVEPSVPMAILRRAAPDGPAAVLVDPPRFIDLRASRSLSRLSLDEWLGAHR